MATQGLVTVISAGKVAMKVVAGIDGNFAQQVADQLKVLWPLDMDEVYRLARNIGFGSEKCLVVLTESGFRFDGDENLHPRFCETFDQPQFNPRWERGAVDHVVVIDV